MNTLRSGVSSISGSGGSGGDNKSTLEKCLEKFTGECVVCTCVFVCVCVYDGCICAKCFVCV